MLITIWCAPGFPQGNNLASNRRGPPRPVAGGGLCRPWFQRNDHPDRRRFAIAERLPIRHQNLAAGVKLAAPVGPLDLVGDGMAQRHLDNLRSVIALLVAPIFQARPEPVRDGAFLVLDVPQHPFHELASTVAATGFLAAE